MNRRARVVNVGNLGEGSTKEFGEIVGFKLVYNLGEPFKVGYTVKRCGCCERVQV